jgi:hypothetical protein
MEANEQTLKAIYQAVAKPLNDFLDDHDLPGKVFYGGYEPSTCWHYYPDDHSEPEVLGDTVEEALEVLAEEIEE